MTLCMQLSTDCVVPSSCGAGHNFSVLVKIIPELICKFTDKCTGKNLFLREVSVLSAPLIQLKHCVINVEITRMGWGGVR
jgi:hypothetical protein